MSMNLTVYVGPYLVVPKTFDLTDVENADVLVEDGRCEAGTDDAELYLIPNVKIDGIDRQTSFDKYGEDPVVQINPATLVRECRLFRKHVETIVAYLDEHEIEFFEGWGVVPCWS